MAAISLQNIGMTYGNNGSRCIALQNVNLTIRDGEFVSLIGPSGCGKSTIIDILAGLKIPVEGVVLIDESQISGPGPDRGTVFQDYSLFPWMTSFENICFAIEQTREELKPIEVRDRAMKYLKLIGLERFRDAYPNTLSGGMRQRVSIARMFSMNPVVFLMDEPFGALDSLNRIYMQDVLLRLWLEGNDRKTVVFVTHDIDEALLLSDRIAVMTPSPGQIKEVVDVPFERPRNRKDLAESPEYIALRSRILSVLYSEMIGEIERQEQGVRGLL